MSNKNFVTDNIVVLLIKFFLVIVKLMLKYLAPGVYVFPRLTLLGLENTDPEFRKLEEVTKYDFDDSDKRNEGVEVKNISAFCLIRDLGRHLNYEPVKVVETEAPGDSQDSS